MTAEAVRRAHVEDAEGIARVHVAAWQHAYRGIVPDDLLAALSVEARTQRWRGQLEASQTWVVGPPTGPLRGFVSVGASRDDDAPSGGGEVYALYVHPDEWGTGVGSRLITTAAEHLAATHSAATLWVLTLNERARTFYARHGWHLDGARKQESLGGVVLEEVRYRLDR